MDLVKDSVVFLDLRVFRINLDRVSKVVRHLETYLKSLRSFLVVKEADNLEDNNRQHKGVKI